MIELKPYRGTIATTVDKGDKKQLVGNTQTGRQAYPWHQNSRATTPVILLLVALFFMACALSAITATPIWFCFAAIITVIIISIINMVWQNYLNQYVGQPTMLVTSEHVRRADEIEVRFRQPIRRDLVIEKSTIELIAREWVRYKCGTDTCTDTHDRVIQTRTESTPQPIEAGTAYEKITTFTIPMKAMHSFAFSDNSLTWIIRVTLHARDFMTLTESYAIQVTPEVHTYN